MQIPVAHFSAETVFALMVPPTVTGVLAIVASRFNAKKLDAIHVLVNSRLSRALDEISDLREEVASLRPGDVSAQQAAASAKADAQKKEP
jgi:hypothetical protein